MKKVFYLAVGLCIVHGLSGMEPSGQDPCRDLVEALALCTNEYCSHPGLGSLMERHRHWEDNCMLSMDLDCEGEHKELRRCRQLQAERHEKEKNKFISQKCAWELSTYIRCLKQGNSTIIEGAELGPFCSEFVQKLVKCTTNARNEFDKQNN